MRKRRKAASKVAAGVAGAGNGLEGFEESLWAIAQEHARKFGFTFEIGCELDFRQLARASSQRMSTMARPEVNIDVRAATEALVTIMIAEARAQGATTLHEWTLAAALAKLCPLFPFC